MESLRTGYSLLLGALMIGPTSYDIRYLRCLAVSVGDELLYAIDRGIQKGAIYIALPSLVIPQTVHIIYVDCNTIRYVYCVDTWRQVCRRCIHVGDAVAFATRSWPRHILNYRDCCGYIKYAIYDLHSRVDGRPVRIGYYYAVFRRTSAVINNRNVDRYFIYGSTMPAEASEFATIEHGAISWVCDACGYALRLNKCLKCDIFFPRLGISPAASKKCVRLPKKAHDERNALRIALIQSPLLL